MRTLGFVSAVTLLVDARNQAGVALLIQAVRDVITRLPARLTRLRNRAVSRHCQGEHGVTDVEPVQGS